MASRVSSNDAYFPVPTIKREVNVLSPIFNCDEFILKSSEKFRKNLIKNTFLKSKSTTYGMNNFDIVSIMNFGLLEF